MKLGDLVRISSVKRPTREFVIADRYHDRTGVIVNCVTQANEVPTWSVLVDGVVIPVSEMMLIEIG